MRPLDRSLLPFCLLASVLLSLGGGLRADVPVALVPENVSDFSLRSPKVFWHVFSGCLKEPDGGPATNWNEPEEIWRIASDGAGSVRKILSENPPHAQGTCNPYEMHSEILADDEHLYWVDPTGLVRLPVTANPGDDPELVSGSVRGDSSGPGKVLLAQSDALIFARTDNGRSSQIWRISKQTLGADVLRTHATGSVRDLSFDGEFLYWLRNSTLERLRFGVLANTVVVLASDVTAYHSEGLRNSLIGGSTHIVFLSKGRRMYRYNNLTGDLSTAIYTSSNAEARIYEISSTRSQRLGLQSGHVFFFESRPVPTPPGNPFPPRDLLLQRMRSSGDNPELLYVVNGSSPLTPDSDRLTTDGQFLYWRDQGRVLRLAADAEALPEVRLRVTEFELTQGIQSLDNDVFLVEGRRTFVRLYVQSDDPSQPAVPGVSAVLEGSRNSVPLGTLYPVNDIGTQITVIDDPDRSNLDHCFLFELPREWTTTGLSLRAEVNPNRVPFEDTYQDNNWTYGPATFEESPRFELHLVEMRYFVDGVLYSPRLEEDVLQLFSYIRRQYPLDSSTGFQHESGRGLRPSREIVFDDKLGSRVDQSHPLCLLGYDSDERSLCASDYAKARMADWKVSRGEPYRVYCAMMRETPDWFPRGSASGLNCTTPTGERDWGWDEDGTFGDWYGAHEIAHCLGRKHPVPASDDPDTEAREGCGHSPSDPSFPYAGARISDAAQGAFGFDAGDALSERRTWPWDSSFDILSYCGSHWVSDYTYEALFAGMHTLAQIGGIAGGNVIEDWLFVEGSIRPESREALVHFLRRHQTPTELSAARGAYAFELLGGGGEILESRRFVGEPSEELRGERLDFSIIAPFDIAARSFRIVGPGAVVLLEGSLSSAVPLLTSASVQTGPSPVSGDVDIEWAAQDADGDELLADISWLPAGRGAAELPLLWSLSGGSRRVSTDELPGGRGRFRVLVSDGVHCAERLTEEITLADKAPVVRIVRPRDRLRVEYSQLVRFDVEAWDPNRRSLGLVAWSLGRRRLGLGRSIAVDDLPVGTNEVRVSVTNAAGSTASDTVTVIVHDDLEVPGPTLSASPPSIAWSVSLGAGRTAEVRLRVSNAGGGGFEFTASESAPWLELDSTGGRAPHTIRVSADASGQPAGTARSTTIRLTMVGSRQVLSVPVTLTVGGLDYLEGGQSLEASSGNFRRGDQNGDGSADISDAVGILGFLFTGGPAPICPDGADVNDDGNIDISDALSELGWLFLGAAEPPAPGPHLCGEDPTADALGDCEVCP